ncbi:transmembrane amino acid transporter protein-domain-containing protein [Pelagophyceae sp. CCMP2097]|nr:transmembrane amino acid transporter protein-domain-containing protein [Pelagophyceae sp. CCMP2097]
MADEVEVASVRGADLRAALLGAEEEEDDETDESKDETDESKSSPLGAGLAMFKCAVGAGSFALPYAFSKVGWALGIGLTFALAALSTYTILLLINAEREIVDRQGGKRLSYPALAGAAFPGAVLGGVNAAHAGCLAGVVATCLGVCAAYLDFCAGVLPPLLIRLFGGDWTPAAAALLVAPAVFALACVDSKKVLSFGALLGNVAVGTGLAAVLVGGAVKGGAVFPGETTRLEGVPLFFGSTVFLFAIHIVVLPIAHGTRLAHGTGARASARHKGPAFRNAVLGAFLAIACVNALFGALAALLFAGGACEGVCPNVLDNFATTAATLDAVRVLLCLDLIFTTPLLLAAPREILEPTFLRWMASRGCLRLGAVRLAFRGALVGLCLALALGIPNFSDMVNLVGGVCNSLMGFVIPPLIHLKLHPGRRPAYVAAHLAIAAAGVFAMVYTTYETARSIAGRS